jgi:DNA/RNA-binding domain of Phe-tRNA-synthetase-like protein
MNGSMNIILDSSLCSIVRLGVIRLAELQMPEDNGDALWRDVCDISAALAEKYRGLTIGQVPNVAHARTLYRSIGIDPTKTRPSSEALLRRVLKDKSLYRIHPLVDLFNLVSLSLLTPVGLYDESKIAGNNLTVRIGGRGEGFDGIRKDRVNVEGRFCISDELGPFGSPTSDSLRTSIDGPVSSALAVFFQHVSHPVVITDECLDFAARLSLKHMGGRVRERKIVPEFSTGGTVVAR